MNSYRRSKEVFICSLVVAGFFLSAVRDADADFIFGTPTNLGATVNSSSGDGAPNISIDGLTLYFTSLRPGGHGSADLWVSTRASTKDDWSAPVNLGPTVNSSAWDEAASLSADGLSLYFDSNRSGGIGAEDIYVTTRATKDSPWGKAVNLGATVNSTGSDMDPSLSADGLSLYFESSRSGGYGMTDLWVTTRANTDDEWGTPITLGSIVNSPSNDGDPSISPDGRWLFFGDYSSPRPGGQGGSDMWITNRATIDDDWGLPINLGPTVNSSANDHGPFISADGSILYFFSTRPGGSGDYDLWQVSIEPIIDFNRDGNVDSADLCILFDYWGTNQSLCDIGPTPLGDGIVDVKDMVVFTEYLLDETLPVDLVAHWKLDELEGIYTKDGVGDNDAIVIGNPASLPTGGMVDGAFEFDGIFDCLVADYVLNPENGPFRVFAWINGGAPGQVVLSQIGGVNWLAMDAGEGNLMTELAGSGPNSSPLLSDTIVTNGEWHLIGLVWDGSHRTLYVDNIAAAKDDQDNLMGSNMGLYIGTSKTMQPGTFFSGKIDDVRIYNRAVSP